MTTLATFTLVCEDRNQAERRLSALWMFNQFIRGNASVEQLPDGVWAVVIDFTCTDKVQVRLEEVEG